MQATYEGLGAWIPLGVKVLKTRATISQLLAPNSVLPTSPAPRRPLPLGAARKRTSPRWGGGGRTLAAILQCAGAAAAYPKARQELRVSCSDCVPFSIPSAAQKYCRICPPQTLGQWTDPSHAPDSWQRFVSVPTPAERSAQSPSLSPSPQCRTCSCRRRRATSSNASWWVAGGRAFGPWEPGARRGEWSCGGACAGRQDPLFYSLFASEPARRDYPPLLARPDCLRPRPPGPPLRASSLCGCSSRYRSAPSRNFTSPSAVTPG